MGFDAEKDLLTAMGLQVEIPDADERTASDVLVDRLIEWGVDTIFGLPGDGINGFMDALRKRHGKIQYIHVRHEEVGAMAAVGYAKFTGKLGAASPPRPPAQRTCSTGCSTPRWSRRPSWRSPG
jgi:pyruvate dehydrogenase (quinone)